MDSVKQTETYAIFSGRVTPILGCLVALAAGVLTTLSAAPFYLWWLGPVAVGLVYWKIHALTPAMAALRGWCYGVGLFGAGTSWVFVAIHDYSDTGAPLALLLTILFVAVLALFFAVPFGLYRRLTGPRLAFLSFAGVWVVSEWLRTWLFTGFPWLLLGTSQIDSPLGSVGAHWWGIPAFVDYRADRHIGSRVITPSLVVLSPYRRHVACAVSLA